MISGVTALGLTALAASGVGVVYMKNDTKRREAMMAPIRQYYEALGYKKENSITLYYNTPHSMKIFMPMGCTPRKFLDDSNALSYTLGVPVRLKHHDNSRAFDLEIASAPMPTKIGYDIFQKCHPYSVSFYTPFGYHYIDFTEEASTHMLLGGAMGTGKSSVIRAVVTQLHLQTKGKAIFYMLDNKINDLEPFFGLPNFNIAMTVEDGIKQAKHLKYEVLERKADILSKGLDKADNSLPHIFFIIDEFARFAEKSNECDAFKEYMKYIAETARFARVHLVVASQRTDAGEIIPPRVRANLTTRIALSTVDETNSKMIIGSGNAANLGGIPGRAIIAQGFETHVQTPYISMDTTRELLAPYYDEAARQELTNKFLDEIAQEKRSLMGVIEHGNKVSNGKTSKGKQGGTGQQDSRPSGELSGSQQEAIGGDVLPDEPESNSGSEPSDAKIGTRRTRGASSAAKR